MNLLLIDIGNTHLSWAIEQDGEFHYGGQTESSEDGIASLFDTRFTEVKPDRVMLANVAGREMGDAISALIAKTWKIQLENLVSPKQACGITSAYSKPAALGIDRWAGMVAGYAMISNAVCVVDCGTAITIDIINSAGLHLGGLILPGYRLMQRAILQKSANVQDIYESGIKIDEIQLGCSTEMCLQQGALLAAKATIEQALELAEKQIGSRIPLLITGGDGPLIQPHLAVPARYEPYLVLKGLALAAKSAELEMKT